jgi:hypothetical protein
MHRSTLKLPAIKATAISLPGLWISLALLPAAGGSALAGSYRVAERSLVIEPPQSYCLIDRKVKAEADLFRFMEEINADLNRVLVVFVDCAELQRWRDGEVAFLQRYGNVLTPIEETSYPGMARGAFLEELRKVMDDAPLLGLEAGQERLEATMPELEVGESENLGIIEADDAALYAGIAQRLEYDGRTFVMLGIFSMTLINDVPLSVNLYRPLKNKQTVARLISEQRRFLQQLLERNRNLQGRIEGPATPDPG